MITAVKMIPVRIRVSHQSPEAMVPMLSREDLPCPAPVMVISTVGVHQGPLAGVPVPVRVAPQALLIDTPRAALRECLAGVRVIGGRQKQTGGIESIPPYETSRGQQRYNHFCPRILNSHGGTRSKPDQMPSLSFLASNSSAFQ